MSRGPCAMARPAWVLRLSASWLALSAAACSEAPAEPPPPAFAVTDSAGVRVVVNSGQQWGEGEGWQVTAEPVVTLGVRDYPVEQQFVRLGEATRLSDGTIVLLEIEDMQLRAFDASGGLLWTAGGVGDGPGESRPYPDTRPVLTKLPGDTLQLQNGQDRIRFNSVGELIEQRKVDYARFRRWGQIFLQYCPFAAYFLHDAIVFCEDARESPSGTDSWTRVETIMRTDWSLDRLDTLGTFFEAAGASVEMDFSGVLADPKYDLVREHFGVRRNMSVSSRFGPKGSFRVGGHDRPRFLYARNDRYRIEVWDILTGALSMVVERRTPRRGWTDEELAYEDQRGLFVPIGTEQPEVDWSDDRWSPLDSVSIAEDFLLDNLGFLWVRRGPSPAEGDEGALREFTTTDGVEWAIPSSSGLHDVFRPDGVYLGTVKLPHDLSITEIGQDYILGIVRDELDLQYVWMYGLDRAPTQKPAAPR
ncbi:MAG: hypothetical protein F4107_08815 [Gemmatimonadetes bacterium]|nr:hypothetical protein [Gemmatimonadota bacterium]MDE2677680.1 hypothetical protein [Gemmatimonadota bacterium]MXX35247.1 hypothetical protein [Gemmatimonadota bacterium]MYI66017.1 hypothetical protein [Gemmatimonadota bacterium]